MVEDDEKETKDPKKVEEKINTGFEVVEVVTATRKVLAFNGKEVDTQELLVALAKHSQAQTGFKFE